MNTPENNSPIEQHSDLIDTASERLEKGEDQALSGILTLLEAVEIAHLMESFPEASRSILWKLMPEKTSGEVLIVIPLAMKRLGIDPALAGSVVLTTVTDVVGFMSFLGLATIFLL